MTFITVSGFTFFDTGVLVAAQLSFFLLLCGKLIPGGASVQSEGIKRYVRIQCSRPIGDE